MIKSGGEWISSIDLENHICGLREIQMACVVAVPHPKWDERPVAVVMLAASKQEISLPVLKQTITKHCEHKFAKSINYPLLASYNNAVLGITTAISLQLSKIHGAANILWLH
ncbi:hypothetical protein CYMTET_11992 [Cymbomonas tetramitiformis]|uniref:AMP-binding enzyme C-terminal domain-containing protein n=1 Tax=Cymbomonas tetramitiformis TaxID=36881 RepID=A0AAE0GLG2_9CHLO|nr:hypothetical protein CYMTET_11992 [Cymbomonas tetramitiformis]